MPSSFVFRWKSGQLSRGPSIETIVVVIICAAIGFNMILAILNANLIGLGRTDVILAEVTIVGLALMVVVLSANRLMLPWVGVTWLLVTIFFCLALMRQSFDPKYLRDVLLIPIFVALGMTFTKGKIIKLFCVIQAAIVAVMIFEALGPELYGRLINPWNYYSGTRWADYGPVWHQKSGLYLSSVRFDGRILLEWTGLHRLSSLFLEPVSLGNWCIIITIFVSAFWRTLSFRTRLYLILSTVILLIGSDSRFAVPTTVLIAVMSLFVHKLPRYIYISYLPGVVVIAAAFVAILGIETNYDNFPGRIARSVNILFSFDLPTLLGTDHSLIERSSDSGISYFILTQSIIGVAALWLFICLLQPPTSRRALVFMHGLCVYLALGLSISYSVFSIKTAAPIWFLYGYIAAREFLDSRMIRHRGVEPSIHGSAIHSGTHRPIGVEAPVAER